MIFKKYPVVVEVRINLHLLDGHEMHQLCKIILLVNFVLLTPHVDGKIAKVELQ